MHAFIRLILLAAALHGGGTAGRRRGARRRHNRRSGVSGARSRRRPASPSSRWPRAIRIRISSIPSRASSSKSAARTSSSSSGASWRSDGCRRSSTAAATRRSSRARNGYLDASANVRILEIPTGQITRAMGDVHPQGNPHYWLDPGNGRRIAQTIRDKLEPARRPPTGPISTSAMPISTSVWPAAESRWDATMAPLQGHEDRDVPPLVAELHGAFRPRT